MPPTRKSAGPAAPLEGGTAYQVTHRVFADAIIGSRVLVLGAVVTGPDKLDARRSYLKAAMEHVNRSEGLLDLVQVQRDFAR